MVWGGGGCYCDNSTFLRLKILRTEIGPIELLHFV